nr:ATP-binding protein [Streptomyces sp. TS71-3]
MLTELRLAAFAGHRKTAVRLSPVTLLAGPSGSGKSTVLRAVGALAGLGGGAPLAEAFPDAAACVPERAWTGPGPRGFRIGCTAEGPAGSVRLDLAVQAEPVLRIVGERLTADGVTLLRTGLSAPSRSVLAAAWHTGGPAPVTCDPFPDDRLGTPLLPLRVAGRTAAQRQVLAAAEQLVVALRSVFACDPGPERMRAPSPPAGGRLLSDCGNLAEVLGRTRRECGRRHARLVAAVRAGCAGPVHDLLARRLDDGTVRAELVRDGGVATPLERLADGELRYVALALVLLTGPGVLAVDPAAEVPDAYQTLTVLADGLDRCLDETQTRELARLADEMCARGHIRLLAAVHTPTAARESASAAVVHLKP